MDFQGFDKQFYVLEQQEDPLEYCSINIPVPMPCGLPCMPCDLPNEFHLFESDHLFRKHHKVMELSQNTSTLSRIVCFPSHREFELSSRDSFGNCPLSAVRRFNLPLIGQPPALNVFLNDQFVGRLVERTRYNFYCNKQTFQHLEVQGSSSQLLYDIVSPSWQRGQCVILPFCGFDTIKWEIRRSYGSVFDDEEHAMLAGDSVGSIHHLFSGLGEYLNKTDLYSIGLPEDATQEERALLLLAPLFIDYLLFQNF